MRGIQEGDGGRVAGIPPDDTARKGEGRLVDLGSISHGRRPANVSDGLPDQGRNEELPCRGLPRKVWDADSDADEFMHPERPVNRDHLGCGRFPSSKMITMSRTCWIQNCIGISVHVLALPGKPSTGQLLGPTLVGKDSRYVCGSPPVDKASQLHRSSFTCMCCIIRWDASV